MGQEYSLPLEAVRLTSVRPSDVGTRDDAVLLYLLKLSDRRV